MTGCVVQVLDMLMAAGLTLCDPVLPTLFHVGRLSNDTFGFLEKGICPEETSHALMIDIAARAANFSSWSKAGSCPQEPVAMLKFPAGCHVTRSTFEFQVDQLTVSVQEKRTGKTGTGRHKHHHVNHASCNCVMPNHSNQPLLVIDAVQCFARRVFAQSL